MAIPKLHKSLTQSSFTYVRPSVFNNFPDECHNSNYNMFKTKLTKRFILDKL